MTDGVELTHASFFSGIGAFDLGLERAGFRLVSHSEVKPYSCAVLETRWPDVPNLGDINAICPDGTGEHECEIPRATVWSGGFPCSDFSVMGKRRGLFGGHRSSLGVVFLDLVRRHRPSFFVLENVPGLLTSHAGKDLGVLLGTVGDLGYGWAYRLLDARDFGLPQARRRLFVVGAPSREDAAAVLDDATHRRLAAPSIAPERRAALGRDREGAALHGEIVLGPTYAYGGSTASIVRKDGSTFTLTPNNFQYVFAGADADGDDVPIVIRREGYFEPKLRRDGSTFTIMPVGGGGYVGEQYVAVPDRDGPGRHGAGFDDLDDLLGGGLGGLLVGRRDGDDGGGRPGARRRGAGDPAGVARPSALGDAPGDPGPSDHSDGVRAPAGVPGRMDDRVGVGDGEVGPKSLDTARWHTLGRACPVPIVEWIGAGIRSVIESRSS